MSGDLAHASGRSSPLDIRTGAEAQDEVAWYENTAGDGSAWIERVILATEWAAIATEGDIDHMSEAEARRDVAAAVPRGAGRLRRHLPACLATAQGRS